MQRMHPAKFPANLELHRGDVCVHDGGGSFGMSTIELVANSGQLSAFEFGHTQTTPAFGCSDQSGIHQLEHGALAESVWDDLGASPLLAEQPLEAWLADVLARIAEHPVHRLDELLPW